MVVDRQALVRLHHIHVPGVGFEIIHNLSGDRFIVVELKTFLSIASKGIREIDRRPWVCASSRYIPFLGYRLSGNDVRQINGSLLSLEMRV